MPFRLDFEIGTLVVVNAVAVPRKAMAITRDLRTVDEKMERDH